VIQVGRVSVDEFPTIVLPSHDAGAAASEARGEPLSV
jgi:hypothetical protein